MSTPTPAPVPDATTDNLTIVGNSIQNMVDFNNYVYSITEGNITACYQMISQTNSAINGNGDPGLTVAVDVIVAAIGAAATLATGGAAAPAAFGCTLLGDVVTAWLSPSSPPPGGAPNSGIGSYLERYTNTVTLLNTELSTISSSAAANWETKYTFQKSSMYLYDLVNNPFNSYATDSGVMAMANAAIAANNQSIWQYVLQKHFHVTQVVPGALIPGGQDTAAYLATLVASTNNLYNMANIPGLGAVVGSMYFAYQWVPAPVMGYLQSQYVLNSGTDLSNPLNQACCNTLFGTPSAPGIAARQDVFTSWRIPAATYTPPQPPQPVYPSTADA